MAVALVTGVFAVLLAVLSWLLNNGSKRGRLLSRIERQTAVLKDLPPDHPARAELDSSLLFDVAALRALAEPRSAAITPKAMSSRRGYSSSLAAVASVGMGFLAILATRFYTNR
jgi:hypothetical protein